MKLSDYVINFLVKEKTDCVFEVCGGAITHLLDSLYERRDIQTISMHHEQAASFAAEGYARIRGNIGVAMATSGPGATNLLTGIASCYFDSIPCLFITGQVNTYEFKFDKPTRQLGFQETDIVSVVKPIVKDVILAKDPDKIRYYLERLVHSAKTGRPGPVLLDIPMNIQRADINPRKLKAFHQKKTFSGLTTRNVNSILKKVKTSSRPVILVGGGVRLSKAEEELKKLVDKTGIPVVSSLMGRDAFDNGNQNFVGMIGTYGNRYSNLTLANADFVLALGTRLDTRQTGTIPETFARGAKIVHVDIDRSELNNKVKVDTAVNCDIKDFLKSLNKSLKHFDRKQLSHWQDVVKRYKKKYSLGKSRTQSIDPNYFLGRLSEFMPKNAVICVDVGQNQMWAAQELSVKKGQRFLTQGGMGSMGSALSMAIGASFADRKRPIVVITGDGGFQLNIQELQTVYEHGLPIKIILLNNSSYGMVKQFQEQYFQSRFQSTAVGYSFPDFQKVIPAYKIKSRKIDKSSQIEKELSQLFRNSKASFLEVKISSKAKILPKLSVNKPIEDQDPSLSRKELKANMFIDLWRGKK